MKHFLSSLTLLLALGALATFSAHAQPASGGPAPAAIPPVSTPLDGGASLLLAGGVAYGLRKLRQRRNR